MKIEILLATEESKNIIKNMYPLYLYDLAEIRKELPNKYGVFEDEDVKTLPQQWEVQNMWFEHPGILMPYIIMADDKPAGFALVATGKYKPDTMDNYLYEFFLLRPFRGEGIAETAAKEVFAKHKGIWQLHTNIDNNTLAKKFWRRTLKNFTDDNYTENQGITFLEEEKIIFNFSSI